MIEGRDWEERAFTVGIGGYAPLKSTFTLSMGKMGFANS